MVDMTFWSNTAAVILPFNLHIAMHFFTFLGHKTTACGALTPYYSMFFSSSSFLYLCKIKTCYRADYAINQCSIWCYYVSFVKENIQFYSILFSSILFCSTCLHRGSYRGLCESHSSQKITKITKWTLEGGSKCFSGSESDNLLRKEYCKGNLILKCLST